MMAACWVPLFNYLHLTYIHIQPDLWKTGLKRKKTEKKKLEKSVCVRVFAQIHTRGGHTDPRASLAAAGINLYERIPKSPG